MMYNTQDCGVPRLVAPQSCSRHESHIMPLLLFDVSHTNGNINTHLQWDFSAEVTLRTKAIEVAGSIPGRRTFVLYVFQHNA